MLHTFKTIKTRGFTLIELLVVIAIIGLLSTIIAAPIQNARKKARDSKKIAEIKAVQLALEQYGEANISNYPTTLLVLAPTYMPILPAAAKATSTQTSDRDKYSYAPYFAFGEGVADEGSMFGYHLGAHLESYSQALDSDRDCHGATTLSDFSVVNGSSTCAFFPASDADIYGFYYASTTGGLGLYENYETGMVPQLTFSGTNPLLDNTGTGVVYDFHGADKATTTCNSTNDCIFDVTGQI